MLLIADSSASAVFDVAAPSPNMLAALLGGSFLDTLLLLEVASR